MAGVSVQGCLMLRNPAPVAQLTIMKSINDNPYHTWLWYIYSNSEQKKQNHNKLFVP